MQFAKNNSTATLIALFLVLTIAATPIALPVVNATENVPTYAFLSIALTL
jgi:hypothetical protein